MKSIVGEIASRIEAKTMEGANQDLAENETVDVGVVVATRL